MSCRVVSFVPSWTETLLCAGIDVVGRTRYCIHPHDRVDKIPIVGGTKKLDLKALQRLSPDFVLMDREENTLEMAQKCDFELIDTHVESISSVPRALEQISKTLQTKALDQFLERWRAIEKASASSFQLGQLPGVREWIHEPSKIPDHFVYVIWKDPWMCVSAPTFIGSVCEKLGIRLWSPTAESRYPEFRLEELSGRNVCLLLSSEPYDFEKAKHSLKLPSGLGAALVDGEKYSWFGARSADFLESELGL